MMMTFITQGGEGRGKRMMMRSSDDDQKGGRDFRKKHRSLSLVKIAQKHRSLSLPRVVKIAGVQIRSLHKDAIF